MIYFHFSIAGDFNNSKLSDLQKVLQSDFFTAVREVYEHVYETVELTGRPEIRANATAKVANNDGDEKNIQIICNSMKEYLLNFH